jgi:hypothetical protein
MKREIRAKRWVLQELERMERYKSTSSNGCQKASQSVSSEAEAP